MKNKEKGRISIRVGKETKDWDALRKNNFSHSRTLQAIAIKKSRR